MNQRFRSIRTLLATAMVSLILASCGSGDVGEPTADSQDAAPSWLFSLDADGATVDGGELVLTGVDDRVTAFTDRPDRMARPVPTSELVAGWSDMFGDDPPNAVLVVEDDDGATTPVVLTLGAPVAGGRVLSFPVEPVDGDVSVPSGRATLTIDSANLPAVGSGRPDSESLSVPASDNSADLDSALEARLSSMLGGSTETIEVQVRFNYEIDGGESAEVPVMLMPPRRVGAQGTSSETVARTVANEVHEWFRSSAPSAPDGEYIVDVRLLRSS